MGARALQEVLGGETSFQALQARVRVLAPLQEAWRQILPAALRPFAQVVGLEGSQLQVRTVNGSVAAKLRQLSPSLVRQLSAIHPGIDSLRLQVSPEGALRVDPSRTSQPLSKDSLDQFASLARQLDPASPLRKAILLLLEHRGR